MADRRHLTVAQVRTRLLAAGYADSAQTIRRLIDSGHLGTEGAEDGWYRTERGGYRMVSTAAVDALIASRQRQQPPQQS